MVARRGNFHNALVFAVRVRLSALAISSLRSMTARPSLRRSPKHYSNHGASVVHSAQRSFDLDTVAALFDADRPGGTFDSPVQLFCALGALLCGSPLRVLIVTAWIACLAILSARSAVALGPPSTSGPLLFAAIAYGLMAVISSSACNMLVM